jgi:hypothetical protein
VRDFDFARWLAHLVDPDAIVGAHGQFEWGFSLALD